MTIEKRVFGRTGHMSTAIVFGAAALGRVDQGRADRVLELLLEYGINHIDVAASYGDAELRIGPWMDRHRDQFFLATKTRERGYESAKAEIHRSLDRLRTDHVDLIQLHALVHPDEWDRALSPGGALDAAVEAREQGLARFIGVTGHGWTVAAMQPCAAPNTAKPSSAALTLRMKMNFPNSLPSMDWRRKRSKAAGSGLRPSFPSSRAITSRVRALQGSPAAVSGPRPAWSIIGLRKSSGALR